MRLWGRFGTLHLVALVGLLLAGCGQSASSAEPASNSGAGGVAGGGGTSGAAGGGGASGAAGGGCSTTCDGTCTGGRCVQTLATITDGTGPFAIAVGGGRVYWTTYGTFCEGETLGSVSIDGGPSSTLAALQGCPGDIAVDQSHVYWADGNAVMKLPLAGGTPAAIPPVQGPNDFAVYGGNIYWTEDNGNVMEAPVAGGSPTTLATAQDQPEAIAVSDTGVYWATSPNYKNGTIMRLPPGASLPVTLATNLLYLRAMALGPTRVCWSFNGNIGCSPVSGATATAFAVDVNTPPAVAVDESNVYWVTQSTLMKRPLDGGTVTTLVSTGDTTYTSIAVDATSVYWSTYSSIEKITPK